MWGVSGSQRTERQLQCGGLRTPNPALGTRPVRKGSLCPVHRALCTPIVHCTPHIVQGAVQVAVRALRSEHCAFRPNFFNVDPHPKVGPKPSSVCLSSSATPSPSGLHARPAPPPPRRPPIPLFTVTARLPSGVLPPMRGEHPGIVRVLSELAAAHFALLGTVSPHYPLSRTRPHPMCDSIGPQRDSCVTPWESPIPRV